MSTCLKILSVTGRYFIKYMILLNFESKLGKLCHCLARDLPFPFLKTILQFFRLHFYPPQTCIAANWLVSVTVIGTLWNPIRLAIVEKSVFLFASISLYKSHSPSLTLLVLMASNVLRAKKEKLILNLRNQRFLLMSL